jgi:hypothetical protein
MGRKIDSIEREIDAIRLQIYEEIKDMTPAQHVDHYNRKAEIFAKKYGLRLVTSVNDI